MLTVTDRQSEKVPSVQCCVLIPKVKLERFPLVIARFLNQIRSGFGGYTFDREVRGSWLERTAGVVHDDHSLVILVDLPDRPAGVESLKRIVANSARDLCELSIFVSIGSRQSIFVWAANDTRKRKPAGFRTVHLNQIGRRASKCDKEQLAS